MLRSIRYGEADRILHLYTLDHGRMSAIAKGARRARSRFGARLEPFFRVRVVLHEGRSELLTVTGVDTVARTPGCASTQRRSTWPRARATRSRGCSRPRAAPEVFTCSPTSSPCSPPIRPRPRPATGSRSG